MNSGHDWIVELDAKTWREGFEAARHGLDVSCNPYDFDEARATIWWFGFQRGSHDLQQNA